MPQNRWVRPARRLGGDPPDLKHTHPTGNISRRAEQLGQASALADLAGVRSPPDSIRATKSACAGNFVVKLMVATPARAQDSRHSRILAINPAIRPVVFFIPIEIAIRSGRSRGEVFSLRAATSAPLSSSTSAPGQHRSPQILASRSSSHHHALGFNRAGALPFPAFCPDARVAPSGRSRLKNSLGLSAHSGFCHIFVGGFAAPRAHG